MLLCEINGDCENNMKAKNSKTSLLFAATALVAVFILSLPDAAVAASASEIDRNSTQALTTLY